MPGSMQGITNAVSVPGPTGTTGSTGAAGVSYNAPVVVVLTDAATIATDASAGTLFRVTMTASRTLGAPTNPADGMVRIWEFIQGNIGTNLLTLNSVFSVPVAITPTLSILLGKHDFMTAIYSGSLSKWVVTAFNVGL